MGSPFRVFRIRIRLRGFLVLTGLAMLLAGCGGGEKSVDDWIEQLNDADPIKRRSALKALELHAFEAKKALPIVAELLKSSDHDNRYRAAKLLSKIGADASCVPALTQALKDPDVQIRYYVVKSLSGIGPDAAEAVPGLVEALSIKDKDNEKIYYYAIKALRKIGPKAQPAAPILKELSQHPNESVRKDATEALRSIEKAGA